MIASIKKWSNVPLICKLLEGTLCVAILVFSRFSGMMHLGSDPVVRDPDQYSKIGDVPWGFTPAINQFGIVVEVAYLFIVFVLICGMLNCQNQLGVNLLVLVLFNLFGALFYGSLCIIQYGTWVQLGKYQNRKYRDFVGITPEWHDPKAPELMAIATGFLGLIFAADCVHSCLLLRKQVRQSGVAFIVSIFNVYNIFSV